MLDQGWRRLHPLSPLVRSGRGLLAVLALAGLSTSGIVGNGTGTRWYDVALPVLIAVAALVNWLVTRWKVDGATLRIETGLLRRDSRQLPIARIQAVDLVRPFFARMLGLAEIRVRLAGSGDADGRLAYLTEAAAFALRARLLAAHHGLDPATPEPAESVVTSVGTGRLAASALISAVPLAVVAVAVGAVIVATTPGGLFAAGAPLAWWLIVCGSIVWRRVSTQYAFTVAVSPDGVRIRRGLLGTVAETIPVPRIQAIRMVEPLLWRPLHWCRLEVDVAGALGHDRPEGTGAVRKALLPVGTKDEARRLLAVALPAASGWPALTRPPRRARLKAPLSYHFLAAGHDGMLAVAVIGRVRRETPWCRWPRRRACGWSRARCSAGSGWPPCTSTPRASGSGPSSGNGSRSRPGPWSANWPRSAAAPACRRRWRPARWCNPGPARPAGRGTARRRPVRRRALRRR